MIEKKPMDKVYKDAGQRIYEIRNMRGLTREELSERAGISVKFLYEIENGKKGFSAMNLYYVSKVLQVGMEYLLMGEDTVTCDQKLIKTLGSFEQYQAECLNSVLQEVHKLVTAEPIRKNPESEAEPEQEAGSEPKQEDDSGSEQEAGSEPKQEAGSEPE